MSVDECRKIENLPPRGHDFINLGLGSVVFNPDTGKAIVPNTGEVLDINELLSKRKGGKGGEKK